MHVAVGMVRIEPVVHIQSIDFVDISLTVVMVVDRVLMDDRVLVLALVLRILVSVVDILVHRMVTHIGIHGCFPLHF